jgi:predicted dehydrogenase
MNWGILGFGYMGKKFLSESKNLADISVVAVASRSQKLTGNNRIQFFSNYKELICNSNLDGLYISTTPNKHFDIIKLGIGKTVPIFCEKPIFFSSKEIAEFNELKQSLYVAENISFMFDTKIMELIQEIKKGLLGKLLEVNIKLQRKLNPYARYRILNPLTSRGALHDYGMYGIHFLNVLFENLLILNYDLKYEGLNDFEGKINFLGNNSIPCNLYYSIELEHGNEIIMKGTNGSVKFQDFLSQNIEISFEEETQESLFGKNHKSKYESSFSNVISKVSEEIMSGKKVSFFTPLKLSILTATSIFEIIDKKA